LEIELFQDRGNLVVRISGELDNHFAGKLKDAIESEWKRDMAWNIIFDLKNLKFMDSSGVGVIMGRYKKVKEKGGKIAICGLSNNMKKIIELSGLLKLVHIYEDVETALNELALI